MNWERTTFNADGLTGERLNATDHLGHFATVVVWPGRATRIFWKGGRTTDIHSRIGASSRSVAVQMVEEAIEQDDRRPLLAKINDRIANELADPEVVSEQLDRAEREYGTE